MLGSPIVNVYNSLLGLISVWQMSQILSLRYFSGAFRMHVFPETRILQQEFKKVWNERIAYHCVGIEPWYIAVSWFPSQLGKFSCFNSALMVDTLVIIPIWYVFSKVQLWSSIVTWTRSIKDSSISWQFISWWSGWEAVRGVMGVCL